MFVQIYIFNLSLDDVCAGSLAKLNSACNSKTNNLQLVQDYKEALTVQNSENMANLQLQKQGGWLVA